jgi:hypothetical protein
VTAAAAVIDPAGGAVEIPAPEPVDVSFALTRTDVEGLLRAMAAADASGPGRTATPDRLRSAIETALGEDRGAGTVLVTRLPRALHSSESWHVRIGGVTPAGRDRITALVSAVRLATPPQTAPQTPTPDARPAPAPTPAVGGSDVQ